MAAASPIHPRRSELDVAVDKVRAGEPLTKRERVLVNQRGEELLRAEDFTDEPPFPGMDSIETTPEDEQDLLEALVEAEADTRQGVRGITAAELFERLRAVG